MLLVADVGNTNTVIGVYDGARLLVSWRLTSRREQTADEYGVFIQALLRTSGLRSEERRVGKECRTRCRRDDENRRFALMRTELAIEIQESRRLLQANV